MTEEVTRTERGWAGHFCCAQDCMFRRNTLLEYYDTKIVVSTVGNYLPKSGGIQEIGYERFYETMAFHSDENDTEYHDVNVSRQVSFNSGWCISKSGEDNAANLMHEEVVAEITARLIDGETFEDEE